MSTATPPTDPDGLAVLHALSRDDLSPKDAYHAVQGLRNMAGQNIIAAIETYKGEMAAKLDAQNAMIAAQNAKLDALRWMIGGGFALLGILIAAFRLLG